MSDPKPTRMPGGFHSPRACAGLIAIAMFAGSSVESEVAKATDTIGDPTRPPTLAVDPVPVSPTDTNSPLQLRAIIFAEGRRVAIINDRRVQRGDVVQSARIVAIQRDHVELIRSGEEIRLHLVVRDVKQPLAAEADDPLATMPPASPTPGPIAAVGSVDAVGPAGTVGEGRPE